MKKLLVICIIFVISIALVLLFYPKGLIKSTSDIQSLFVYSIDEDGMRVDITQQINTAELLKIMQVTTGQLQIAYQPYHLGSDVNWEIEVIGNDYNFIVLLGSINYKYYPKNSRWVRYQIQDPSKIILCLKSAAIH